MCGIVGKSNFNNKINYQKFVFSTNLLSKRGPDDVGFYNNEYVTLGHRRLSVVDLENGKQPMSYKGYTIVYNGELYNTLELREDLEKKGYHFDSNSDTEVLLKLYFEYKEEAVKKLNGIFAFIVYGNNKLYAARDRLGVKPMYYCIKDNDILIASEQKVILNYFDINEVTKEGLQELIGLGPSHTPGVSIYKGIDELREGCHLFFDGEIKIKRYWNVFDERFDLSFDDTKKFVRELLTDSIRRQLVSDVKLCTFLSGGIDSSIITAVSAKNKKELDTFSIDYDLNDKSFKSNSFQVSKDSDFINYVTKMYKTNHTDKTISLDELSDYLEESVIARDMPGMADIDSSLLWFSKEVKETNTVALSGECADEIFGGYPWFYRSEKYDVFPWIRSLDDRINLLNKDLKDELNIKEYVQRKYDNVMNEIETDDEHKKMYYINLKYFMQTLLERKDKMTMRGSLEVRVPFADHRLVEFLYNVPFDYKYINGVEKGLLREAFKDLLPTEIYNRKKSPYPKTHSSVYTKLVVDKLEEALMDENSILYKVFDKEKLYELLESEGKSFKKPWFGQLMTGPQLIAYLYQFHFWGKEYSIKIC